jgi:SH3-like domain-containing protein
MSSIISSYLITKTIAIWHLNQHMQHIPRSSVLTRSFVLLATWSLLVFSQAASAQSMVSVDRNTVNLRSSDSTNSTILFELGKGYPLQVISRKGSWLKVRDFENDRGWIHRPLVGNTPHLVVKVNIANIRSAPNTNSRVLGKVQYGELLRTLDRRSQWVRVQQESGAKGWVSRALLWGW